MSEDYIKYLENEVDLLHKALRDVADQLEDIWDNSLTVGLVPELHYKVVEPQQHLPQKLMRKKWKSLRLLREYIKSQYNSGNKVHLKTFDAGDNRTKIYDDISIVDGDDVPITYYFIEHYIEKTK